MSNKGQIKEMVCELCRGVRYNKDYISGESSISHLIDIKSELILLEGAEILRNFGVPGHIILLFNHILDNDNMLLSVSELYGVFKCGLINEDKFKSLCYNIIDNEDYKGSYMSLLNTIGVNLKDDSLLEDNIFLFLPRHIGSGYKFPLLNSCLSIFRISSEEFLPDKIYSMFNYSPEYLLYKYNTLLDKSNDFQNKREVLVEYFSVMSGLNYSDIVHTIKVPDNKEYEEAFINFNKVLLNSMYKKIKGIEDPNDYKFEQLLITYNTLIDKINIK